MKVYVITKGEYSDYSIIGVSLDEEKAKIIAKAVSDKYDTANVEEYDTETFDMIKKGETIYEVLYRVKTNTIEKIEDSLVWWQIKINEVQVKYWYNEKYLLLHVSAKDKDHAFKIAVDLINEYKARENGIAI